MLTSAGSTLASIALTSSEPVPGGDVPKLLVKRNGFAVRRLEPKRLWFVPEALPDEPQLDSAGLG